MQRGIAEDESFRVNKRYDYWYIFIAAAAVAAIHSAWLVSVCQTITTGQPKFLCTSRAALTILSDARRANYRRIDFESGRVRTPISQLCVGPDIIIQSLARSCLALSSAN